MLTLHQLDEPHQARIARRAGTGPSFHLPMVHEGHRLRRAMQIARGPKRDVARELSAFAAWGIDLVPRHEHRLAERGGQLPRHRSVAAVAQGLFEIQPIVFGLVLLTGGEPGRWRRD
jgi:hypothetical protein